MKRIVVSAMLLCLALAPAVLAGEAKEVTLEGKVVCAKCALHEEGRTKCQNVLVVEEKGEARHYYMAETEAATELGEVCMGDPVVRITGTVEEKDGHTWIAASEIERVEKKG